MFMFIAAKMLAFLTQPLAWVALLIFASLLCVRRSPACSQRLGSTALVLLLMLGWQPLPDALLRPLEAQYPPLAPERDLSPYAGVIVLGGALEPAYVWSVPGQSALNSAAERMTAALPLLRQSPNLRLLFTGGEGELLPQGRSEADRARQFF